MEELVLSLLPERNQNLQLDQGSIRTVPALCGMSLRSARAMCKFMQEAAMWAERKVKGGR